MLLIFFWLQWRSRFRYSHASGGTPREIGWGRAARFSKPFSIPPILFNLTLKQYPVSDLSYIKFPSSHWCERYREGLFLIDHIDNDENIPDARLERKNEIKSKQPERWLYYDQNGCKQYPLGLHIPLGYISHSREPPPLPHAAVRQGEWRSAYTRGMVPVTSPCN